MTQLSKPSDISGLLTEARKTPPLNDFQSLAANDDAIKEREKTADDQMQMQEDFENPAQEVAMILRRRYESAQRNKQMAGIPSRDELCLRHRRAHYSPAEQAILREHKQEEAFFPLADRHCRTLHAFIRNILTPDDNHPLWDIKPTPIPVVPEALARQEAQDLVDRTIDNAIINDAGINPDVVQEQARTLRKDLLKRVNRRAEDGVEQIKEIIEDELLRTDFERVIDTALDDFVTRPASIIKGPEIAVKKEMYWDKGDHKVGDHKYLRVRNVDPAKFYPSADSTTTQDGTYVIELADITRCEWHNLRNLEGAGFIKRNIDLLLKEFCFKPRNWLTCRDDERNNALMDKPNGGVTEWEMDESTPVIMHYGKMSGKMLMKAGVENYRGEEIDELKMYEMQMWSVDKLLVRVACPLDPLCERPYHKACSFPIVGSFWGYGIPNVIEMFTRIINGAVRGMATNMGMMGKPVTVLDIGAVDRKAQKTPTSIDPGDIIYINSQRSDSRQPLNMIQIQSQAESYIAVIREMSRYADEVSGLPAFLAGQPATGGAARTLGGFNALQQNVGIGLKSMVVQLDLGFIKPLIKMYYRFLMATTDEAALKVDADVEVYGATQLLAREVNKDRLLQAINISVPFVQSGLVPQNGIAKLLDQLYTELGQDADEILRDGLTNELLQDISAANTGNVAGGIPASGPGGQAAVQAPVSNAQSAPGLVNDLVPA